MSSRAKKRAPEAIGPTLDFDVFSDQSSTENAKVQMVLPLEEVSSEVITDKLFSTSIFALSSIKSLGHKGVRALDHTFGLGKIWGAEHSDLLRCLSEAHVPSAHVIATTILNDTDSLLKRGENDAAQMAGVRGVHVVAGVDLPSSLRNIPGAPQWLFVQGNVKALYASVAVALVGTRKPSDEGLRATGVVSDMLAPYPVTIVSGLAEGIDECAHYATLQRHKTNVAFLGHGINFEFPAKTVDLRKRIVEQNGAVATEYLPDEKYQKSYFVERNRLQAGLSNVVIPIEATSTGGTSHTVRFAQKYKRFLMGIRWPGADGILADLGYDPTHIFNVFTPDGRREFDAELKRHVATTGSDTYPLCPLERRVLTEFKLRNASKADIQRFIKTISNELD